MKRNYFKLFGFAVLFICFCAAVSGCVFVVGGAIGAVGGYAISSDTVEGMLDKSYESVWEASEKVANIMGNTKFKDSKKGYIEAESGRSKININIEKVTEETTKIRIKARKYNKFLPDISLAQKIYTKIIQEAK